MNPTQHTRLDRLGPFVADAIRHFRSPVMPIAEPGGVAPYALLPSLAPGVKPTILPSLEALARRIHRERGSDALQLSRATLTFRDRARHVTQVMATEPASGRTRLIGYAWHAGRPWEALQAALDRTVPAATVEG